MEGGEGGGTGTLVRLASKTGSRPLSHSSLLNSLNIAIKNVLRTILMGKVINIVCRSVSCPFPYSGTRVQTEMECMGQ